MNSENFCLYSVLPLITLMPHRWNSDNKGYVILSGDQMDKGMIYFGRQAGVEID